MIAFIPGWFVLHQNGINLLTQAMLAFLIALLFLWGQQKSRATWMFIAFFAWLGAFLLGAFISLSSYLFVWRALMIAPILVACLPLIQFAYIFPNPVPEQTIERRVALAVNGLFLLLYIGLIAAFLRTPSQEGLQRCSIAGSGMFVVLFVWVVLIFARRAVGFTSKNETGGVWRRIWKALVHPIHPNARASRALMWVCASLALTGLWMAILSILTGTNQISQEFIRLSLIFLTLGILFFQFALVLVYLNYAPEASTLLIRLMVTILTIVLSAEAVMAQLALDIFEIPYYQFRQQDVQQVRAALDAAGAGQQLEAAQIPANVEFVLSRPLSAQEGKIADLYTQHFVKNGPLNFDMISDAELRAALVTNMGRYGEQIKFIYHFQQGEREVVVGYPIDFARDYINQMGIPITLTILATTLIVLLALPAFFRSNLVSPLNLLVKGMRQVHSGDLETMVARQYNDEIGFMIQSFNEMVIGLREREWLRDIFGRFVSQDVAEALRTGQVKLEGENRMVSVLFCDIRGFTARSEKSTPEKIVSLLNEYLPVVVDAASHHHGTVNKFGGDSTLVIYGAPRLLPESAYYAVLTALEVRANLEQLNQRLIERGDDPIRIGVGINTGMAMAGAVGPRERQEYTVIGDSVNLAARIEALNKEYPEYDILIGEQTYTALGEHQAEFDLVNLEAVAIRGKAEAVRVWAVKGFLPGKPSS